MTKEPGFLSLLDMPSAWPREGDRLLRTTDDTEKGVGFSKQATARHVHIWSGYMHAGKVLIEECGRTPSDRHFLVYPILFCYRQGLELAMKWIISQYGQYANITGDRLGHDLWRLWKDCKQVILTVGSDGDGEDLRAVEQIVKDFHDLDKTAEGFRYSRHKGGGLIPLPDRSLDMQNVKDVMDAIDNLFTGADGQLDHNARALAKNVCCHPAPRINE